MVVIHEESRLKEFFSQGLVFKPQFYLVVLDLAWRTYYYRG